MNKLEALTGKEICRLMRKNKQTLRSLSKRMGVTMARVRHVRASGVTGFMFASDWYEGITGKVAPGFSCLAPGWGAT
jgi:hypothetical protein